jgi:hypothetical protein
MLNRLSSQRVFEIFLFLLVLAGLGFAGMFFFEPKWSSCALGQVVEMYSSDELTNSYYIVTAITDYDQRATKDTMTAYEFYKLKMLDEVQVCHYYGLWTGLEWSYDIRLLHGR